MSIAITHRTRADFVDELRGLAVVLMILWHTADSWLLPGLRDGRGWGLVRIVGGMAAPLFVLLAGVGVGWKLASKPDRAGRTAGAATRLVWRGVGIIALGYLLRLQMWAVDAHGASQPGAWMLIITFVVGGLGIWIATQLRSARLWVLCGSFAVFSTGVWILFRWWPQNVSLLRVDILQCIGACIVVLGAGARWTRKPVLACTLGVVVALSTSFVETIVPGVVPAPIAAFIAQTPHDSAQLGAFPLFPWLGYAWVGAAIGNTWCRAHAKGTVARSVVLLGALGALVAMATSESFPYAFRYLVRHDEMVPVFRMFFRVGIALIMATAVLPFAQGMSARSWRSPVRDLGQTSLLIYWVHLPIVYGLFSRSFKRTMFFDTWAICFSVLVVTMIIVARFRLDIVPHVARNIRNALRDRGILDDATQTDHA